MRRLHIIFRWTALIASAIFLIAAGFLLMQGSAAAGWIMLFALLILGFVGAQALHLAEQQHAVYERKAGEVSMLQGRIEQQASAVDVLADGLDIAIFISDLRGGILYANRRARDMFRFEDIAGRSVLAVTLSYELERLVLEAAEDGEVQSSELLFSFPEERTGIVRAWLDQDSRRVFLSIYEITRLRRLERIRQDFVSNVSHELRTPLTLIRAMAETLLDDPADKNEQTQKYLGQMISEVDRLASLSNDLLILSTAESNTVRKQHCDIAEVFKNVEAQLRRKAEKKGLVLSFEGPEHCQIEANMAQMTQVALNLIDNAINYSVAGEILVKVVAADPVLVKVSDQGIGIASEHLPRIFERFYRIDKARSRVTGGTGLGLSIVKHIVEAHGGTVSVESSLNRGSTFTVSLPTGS